MIKWQEVAKKWLKLKESRKQHICGIHRLTINNQVKNLQVVLKEGPFVNFGIFLT